LYFSTKKILKVTIYTLTWLPAPENENEYEHEYEDEDE